jgi:hypothetical protein
MKISLLQLSVFLFLLICSPFNANAEIIAGSSIEWLTVSSKVVAVGKITSVEKSKGEGSVIYETYVFEPSEMIKGAKQKKKFNFTIRTFSTEPVFGKLFNTTNEIVVFLSDYKNDGEKFLQDKLVPANTQFPLSIINLNNPNKYVIDLNFRVLKNKDDIIKASQSAAKAQTEYLKQHSSDLIKSVSLEVPMDSEAFRSLYAGSVCYLIVPNFMSAEVKKTMP